MHGYYIKQHDVYTMGVPKYCSWVVRKIFGARDYLENLHNGSTWIQNSVFSIKNLYSALMGSHRKLLGQRLFVKMLLLSNAFLLLGYCCMRDLLLSNICRGMESKLIWFVAYVGRKMKLWTICSLTVTWPKLFGGLL